MTSSCFRFLKFPSLVLSEIIRSSNPDSLVCLSLCSQKAHHLVKSENRRFSEFKLLMIQDASSMAVIETQNSIFNALLAFPIEEASNANSLQSVKIRDRSVVLGVSNGNLCTFWEDPVLGFKEIMEYVSDLFNVQIYQIVFRRTHLWMIDWVQSRQNCVPCATIPESERLTAEEYQFVMDTCTAETLELRAIPPDNFETLEAFIPRQRFLIFAGGWVRMEHLLRMNAAELLVDHSNLVDHDVLNIVLKQWLAGELRYLKTMRILTMLPISRDAVFRDLESKMTLVEHKRQYAVTPNNRLIVPRNTMDIKRKDGRVASVQVFQLSFNLLVWPDNS